MSVSASTPNSEQVTGGRKIRNAIVDFLTDARRRILTRQVLFTAVATILACLFNTFSQVAVERLSRSRPAAGVLPDLGFHALPRLRMDALADYWVFGSIAGAILLGLATPGPKEETEVTNFPSRWVMMRRYAMFVGCMFFVRAWMIVATVLPQPQDTCVATVVTPGRPGPVISAQFLADGVLVMLGARKTCADMFFSGHTANMTFALLLARRSVDSFGGRLRYPARVAIKSAMTVAWVVGCVLIIATRLHYTIDVVAGALFALAIFHFYHHCLVPQAARAPASASPLTRKTLLRFVAWLEAGAEDLELFSRRTQVTPAPSPTTCLLNA